MREVQQMVLLLCLDFDGSLRQDCDDPVLLFDPQRGV